MFKLIKWAAWVAVFFFLGFVLLAATPFGIVVVGCTVVTVLRRFLKQCLPPDSGLIVGQELVFYSLAVAIPVQAVVGLLLLLHHGYRSGLYPLFALLALLAVGMSRLPSWQSSLGQIRRAPGVLWGWFGDFIRPFFSTFMNLFAGFFEAAGFDHWNKLFGALTLWFILAVFFLPMVCAGKMLWRVLDVQSKSIYFWAYGAAIWLVLALWFLQAFMWLGRATLVALEPVPLSLRAVKWNNCDAPLEDGSSQIKLVHLSDLHIPSGKRLTESSPTWPDDALARCFQKVSDEKPAAIVLTGDVTDTGDKNAWEKFKILTKDLKIPIVLTPGNHDLNIVGFGAWSLLLVGDLPQWRGRWLRMERYMDTAAELMGSTAYVFDANGAFITLQAAWCEVKVPLAAGNVLSDVELYRRAGALFPMFVESSVGTEAALCFVVWNSVRPTRLAFNNSFGEVDEGQLSRYEKYQEMEKVKKRGAVHLVHHKLALPKDGLIWEPVVSGLRGLVWLKQIYIWMCRRIQMAGMVMINADDFVEKLAKYDTQKVLLHGHHHSQFHGDLTRSDKTVATVVSARSTTLGAESWDKGSMPVQPHSFDVLYLSAQGEDVSLVFAPQAVVFILP